MKEPTFLEELADRLQKRVDRVAEGTFSNGGAEFGLDLSSLAAYLSSDPYYAGKTERFGEVAVRAFWFVIEGVKATQKGDQAMSLEITSLVPDRQTGAPLRITFTRSISMERWSKPEERLAQIRAAMRSWLLHEIDENLFLNDVRVFDPHAQPVTFEPVPFEPTPDEDPFRMSGYRFLTRKF